MIPVTGAVLLTADEAAYLVRALDAARAAGLLDDKRLGPNPRVAALTEQLRRASRKCDARETRGVTKLAQGAQHPDDDGHAATVSTGQAAAVLGVTPAAVRALARRGRLASHRVGDRWRHDLAAVEQRAQHRG